ncbi:MAG: hypothetical protein A2V70_19950 [Planctomycetes bacterium RBG_13_63_9]|nr:MAG: hypothetical protein A2V70_19950 [Planctomycetes bacterium RBG_13_63_9]
MVTVALGTFSGLLQAEKTYHVVKVWPEMPLGWHFYQPFGIAVDKSDDVYVGDSGSYRIKKFDAEGRFITQWGSPGQGDGQFTTIRFVKVGRSGTVYVVDENARPVTHSRIQKFTPYGQFIGLFERTAPDVNQADLSIDVTEDDQGNVFVLAVDYVKKESRIRRAAVEKYSPDGEFLAQWGMDAGSEDGQLQLPGAIAIDANGNFYVTELFNNRVQKFDPSGKFLLTWGTRGEGEGRLSRPYGIAIDRSGDVYIRDNYGVQKFTPEGGFLAGWKAKGSARGIALDSHANVYVTDRQQHAVSKLDSAGNVVSQWGKAGSGDGRFSQPGSIAVDPSGHIVVADVGNFSIQRLTSEGRFASKWGGWTDSEAYSLATDASGNIYAACGDANEVQKFDPDGKLIGRWGSGGTGDGQFLGLSSIAVGPSDNVYVTDTGNNPVQKFTSDGKFLAKWGTKGTGDGQFSGPFFVAVDHSGNVWVGDQLVGGTHRMQKFDAEGNPLTRWTRKITRPHGTNLLGAVAVDSAGNSYYAFENRVEKYDPEGNLVRDYGQEEFPKDAIGPAWGVSVDQAGCLYVTGPANAGAMSLSASGAIRKFDPNGRFVAKWTAENTDVKRFPNGPIAMDRAGNVYGVSWGSPSIQKLSSDGKLVAEARLAAPRGGGFSNLEGVAVDGSGKVYAVNSIDVDWGWSVPWISQFDPNGQFITMWEVPAAAKDKFKYPVRIAVDGSGNMYITDHNTHCVHKLDAQGQYIKSWGEKGTGDGQFDAPEGIAVDGTGHVYVCDRQNSRIQKFDSDGNFLAKWGKEGSGDGEFHFPAAVAVDREGNVFVADSNNHRVQKFTVDGKFLTQWGEFGEAPGQFNVPRGITVDKAGNVYVSDSHNHRIQKFAPARPR